MERKEFTDQLEALNFVVQHMTTTEELAALEKRVTAIESKVDGINRRLDSEAMERVDVGALLNRVAKLEDRVFGNVYTYRMAFLPFFRNSMFKASSSKAWEVVSSSAAMSRSCCLTAGGK